MFVAGIRVQAGSALTYEDLKSGFTFRVANDGVVERSLTDQLASPQVLERADDRRLRQFAADQAKLREKALPEAETRAEIGKSAEHILGTDWKLKDLNPGPGGGINCETLELPDGQSVYLNFYERTPTVTLTTQGSQDGWGITHRVEGPLDGSAWVESAEFNRG